MDHLEKLESFIDEKHKKMKKLQKKRMRQEKRAQIVKNIFSKNNQPIALPANINDDTSSDDELKKNSEKGTDSELSGDEKKGHGTHTTMTAFDDFDTKSIDEQGYQITERAQDEEQAAKEEYMRRLMSFRKDELVLPDDSDEDEEEGSDGENGCKQNKDKNVGAEEAYDLVEKIEQKMNSVVNVIRGMDKRMSYNLRLIGSCTVQDQPQDGAEATQDIKDDDIMAALKGKSIQERKENIIPKIKKMSDFASSKL